MRIITPNEFWAAFSSVLREREGDLAVVSGVHSKWVRTKFFLEPKLSFPKRFHWLRGIEAPKDNVGILERVAQQLGLGCRREVLNVDALYYDQNVIINHPLKLPGHVLVAIEHENDVNTSHHELWKLSLLCVPLKVLITYPGHSRHRRQFLSLYSDILKLMEESSDFFNTKKQLVIFGYPWEGYVYQKGSFVPLEDSP